MQPTTRNGYCTNCGHQYHPACPACQRRARPAPCRTPRHTVRNPHTTARRLARRAALAWCRANYLPCADYGSAHAYLALHPSLAHLARHMAQVYASALARLTARP